MWTVVRQVCFQEKQRRHCLDRFFFFFLKGEPFQLGEADFCQSTGDRTGGRAHGPTAVAIRGLVYEWLDPRHALELQEARQVLEGAPQP